MKKKKYLLFLLIFVSILSGCKRFTGIPEDFDYGKIENNKYTNNYFNCEMIIPEKWNIQSKEQMQKLSDEGHKMISGGDSTKEVILKAADVRTANLIAVFKYDQDSAASFNPSILISAENVLMFPSVKNGSDYLAEVKKIITKSSIKYDYVDSTFKKMSIDDVEFYTLRAFTDNLGIEVHQLYLSTIIKGFSFSVIITYNNKEEKKELLSILRTLKFKKQSPSQQSLR